MTMRAHMMALFLVLLAALGHCQTSEAQEKVAVMHYNYTDSGWVETRSTIVYGLPPDLPATAAYTATVRNGSGAALEEFQFSDPRYYFGDEIGENGMTGLSGFDPSAELVLVLRFNNSMDKLVISNSTSGQKIFETNLSPLVQDFCASHPQDADCITPPAKITGFDFGPYLLPALAAIIIIVAAVIFMKTRGGGHPTPETGNPLG